MKANQTEAVAGNHSLYQMQLSVGGDVAMENVVVVVDIINDNLMDMGMGMVLVVRSKYITPNWEIIDKARLRSLMYYLSKIFNISFNHKQLLETNY